MLHRIMPARSALVRDAVAAHFGRPIKTRRPLAGPLPKPWRRLARRCRTSWMPK
jgi:hypothetical protein